MSDNNNNNGHQETGRYGRHGTPVDDVQEDIAEAVKHVQQTGGSVLHINALSLNVTRRSALFLFDFLRKTQEGSKIEDSPPIKELIMTGLTFDSTTNLPVVCDFFASSSSASVSTPAPRRLTKVTLDICRCRSLEDAEQLLAAFETNRTVTDLTITTLHVYDPIRLPDSMGRFSGVARILQNNTFLRRLDCRQTFFSEQGFQTLQTMGLRSSIGANLKTLNLARCDLGDRGIRAVANGLLADGNSNTTLQVLKLHGNGASSASLPLFTRILEATQVKVFSIDGHLNLSDSAEDHNNAARFSNALRNSRVLESLAIVFPEQQHQTKLGEIALQAAEEGNNAVLEELYLPRFEMHNRDRPICHELLTVRLPRLKTLKTLYLEWDVVRYLRERGNFDIPDQRKVLEAFTANTSFEAVDFVTEDLVDLHDRGPRLNGLQVAIRNTLVRNRHLHRAKKLLALQRRTRRPIPSTSGIWPVALEKLGKRTGEILHGRIFFEGDPFATDSSLYYVRNGTSAIFKILQTRPAILDVHRRQQQQQLRCRRPATATASAAQVDGQQHDDATAPENDDTTRTGAAAKSHPPPKRARLH